MRLLSFVADGKECFGAVSGDGVVTLNDKIGQPDLRAALAAGAMEAMRQAAQTAKPDHKLGDIEFLPLDPKSEQDSLRRRQLPRPRRRGRPRTAEAAEHVHPLRRYAGRPRRRDDPA